MGEVRNEEMRGTAAVLGQTNKAEMAPSTQVSKRFGRIRLELYATIAMQVYVYSGLALTFLSQFRHIGVEAICCRCHLHILV